MKHCTWQDRQGYSPRGSPFEWELILHVDSSLVNTYTTMTVSPVRPQSAVWDNARTYGGPWQHRNAPVFLTQSRFWGQQHPSTFPVHSAIYTACHLSANRLRQTILTTEMVSMGTTLPAGESLLHHLQVQRKTLLSLRTYKGQCWTFKYNQPTNNKASLRPPSTVMQTWQRHEAPEFQFNLGYKVRSHLQTKQKYVSQLSEQVYYFNSFVVWRSDMLIPRVW